MIHEMDEIDKTTIVLEMVKMCLPETDCNGEKTNGDTKVLITQ